MVTGEVSEIQMLLEKYFNVYKDRIGLEKCLPRQQDKCRERHEQAAINAPQQFSIMPPSNSAIQHITS